MTIVSFGCEQPSVLAKQTWQSVEYHVNHTCPDGLTDAKIKEMDLLALTRVKSQLEQDILKFQNFGRCPLGLYTQDLAKIALLRDSTNLKVVNAAIELQKEGAKLEALALRVKRLELLVESKQTK